MNTADQSLRFALIGERIRFLVEELEWVAHHGGVMEFFVAADYLASLADRIRYDDSGD